MRPSFASRLLSSLLVVAVASVAAHPSADGAYAVPATLRGVPPSLMVENMSEGTLPLVYGIGISKNPARMGFPGALQARAVSRSSILPLVHSSSSFLLSCTLRPLLGLVRSFTASSVVTIEG